MSRKTKPQHDTQITEIVGIFSWKTLDWLAGYYHAGGTMVYYAGWDINCGVLWATRIDFLGGGHQMTNCVKQFRLGIAINRRFECSVFSVQNSGKKIVSCLCFLLNTERWTPEHSAAKAAVKKECIRMLNGLEKSIVSCSKSFMIKNWQNNWWQNNLKKKSGFL